MRLTSASRAGLIVFAFALPTYVCGARVDAQSHGGSPLSVAIDQVSRGDFSDGAIGVIVQYHGVEAIPALKKQFEIAPVDASDFLSEKDEIAEVLVQLHAEGDVYWKYLVARVQQVLDCDAPDPFVYDAQGKVDGAKVSPEFTDWAKEHRVVRDLMIGKILEDFPLRIMRLASTGDSRAIPLLRSALASHIGMIQAVGAEGLAKLQDNASVPLIIDACKRAHSEIQFAIAMNALIYFDDPSAQQLAVSLLPVEVVKAMKASGASKEPF